ncbi:DUF1080 domain-containing protein [Pontiellaceae bacterium B12227]|nr:DUF1080 domain-containing protein [Pontiellaceae bacterium B12227]
MKPKTLLRTGALLLGCSLLAACATTTTNNGSVSLFNGKDLEGWTPAKENPDSFFVEDGVLILKGGRCHLFYTGDVNGGSFKNFELNLQVKTTPGSNSGVYIHTKYQDTGWPESGYECQVNSSHKNVIKTGSLFDVQNIIVMKPGQKEPKNGSHVIRDASPSTDGEWFDYRIVVSGSNIKTYVNDELLVDYDEPEGGPKHPQFKGRKLSEGTFALQAHDPKCEVHYRNIKVKVLD